MKIKKVIILSGILLPLLIVNLLIAQDINNKPDSFIADQKFNNGNYEGALDEYLALLDNSKTDKYNYNIAICYLNTNINKTKAIPYLEIITHKPKYDPNAMYLLGRAYHYAYRFDDAIKAFNTFKQSGHGNADNLSNVDRQIQFCMNAKELMKFPLNAKFENMGMVVNSPYADYYPFVPDDESFIVFNTHRPDDGAAILKEDGSYPATVYISKVVDGAFTKAKNTETSILNKGIEQEVIGLSATGENMLLYQFTDQKKTGDIYIISIDKNKNFKLAEKLSENINSVKSQEISACISSDGSVIYFASNREGGQGGTDLYMSHQLPNGTWGPAQNMGADINTSFDEDFPTISSDGKTFYFSSNGHTSMGGYDIFKAELNPDTKQFSNPKNVGYPINTPEDNYNLRISSNGRFGYISALRDGGLGDLDIYRVTFNEVEPQYSVLKGNINSSDSTRKLNSADVFITVRDNKSQEVIGNYLPNPNSGRYIIILPPGVYDLSIEATGFQTKSEKINVLDKSSYKFEISKDIQLIPDKHTKISHY